MLVVFPPIFVADTKIIYGYNIAAPLKHIVCLISLSKDFDIEISRLSYLELYFDMLFAIFGGNRTIQPSRVHKT